MKPNTILRAWLIGTATLALLLQSGCAVNKSANRNLLASGVSNYDPCKDNLDQNLPIITCQPMDQNIQEQINGHGKPVTFYVKAKGDITGYQWYFSKPNNSEPQLLANGTGSSFTIPEVSRDNYGVYFCVIAAEGPDGFPILTQTRYAELGGRKGFGGGGGAFAAMQYTVANSTTTTICGQTVSGKWVKLPGTQTPKPDTTSFRGQLFNITTGTDIPKGDYLLQWWVTAANTGCCSEVPDPLFPFDVTCPIDKTKIYKFIAHYKVGKAPPINTVIELRGAWQPTP